MDPLSSSGRYRRSARWQMRQAKPAMLTEVDICYKFGGLPVRWKRFLRNVA